MNSLEQRFLRLCGVLDGMGSAVVAYSGGVDSSFLLRIAKDHIKNLIAVTANSETYTKHELKFAKELCKRLGVRHRVIATRELADNNFKSNPRDRCYFCKKELFSKLWGIAKKNRINFVLDASNIDDKKDFRPGRIAKKEFGVVSPLEKARLGKRDIRLLSKRLKLSSWNRPQMACLASRVSYGEIITKDKLKKIEKAENIIRKHLELNGNVRVRYHRGIARIEVDKKEIPRLIKDKNLMVRLKKIGFKYITVDLEGYAMGSMNRQI